MKEKRREQRHPMAVEIKVSHEAIGEVLVKTKNLSDSGLFIVTDPKKMPPIGTRVNCQIQRNGEEFPIVPMEIVRTTDGGLGLLMVTE